MSSDPTDELARARARRERARGLPRPNAADDARGSTEQEDAIARARESWALSQIGRERHAQRSPEQGTPRDPFEDGQGASAEDD